MIGFGHGLFAVGMLTAAMMFGGKKMVGLTLGAWGAVQASASGVAVFSGGAIRDLVSSWGEVGLLGMAMRSPAAGYLSVYIFEVALLFLALASLGPLARRVMTSGDSADGLKLDDFPN